MMTRPGSRISFWVVILVFVVLVFSVFGILRWGRREPSIVGNAASRSQQTHLEIGYSALRISLPIFVAQERGIFAKHGLVVQLRRYDTAQPLMQALAEKKIDLGGYTALPISYSAIIRSHEKLVFITAMIEDHDHRISYLLRKKTPNGGLPLIKSIADLRGRRIG